MKPTLEAELREKENRALTIGLEPLVSAVPDALTPVLCSHVSQYIHFLLKLICVVIWPLAAERFPSIKYQPQRIHQLIASFNNDLFSTYSGPGTDMPSA